MTTESNHTPGPWRYVHGSQGDGWAGIAATVDHAPVCIATARKDDARLIAAAPDMLTALRNVLDDDVNLVIALESVKAAIRKAEGFRD